jgi:cytochrome c biogenesis protein
LTSVKVAIVILIVLIAASILGTLIPQGRSGQEYMQRYGQLGGLFQRLQFTRLYQSFWYIAILALFSLNIIVCTLERLSPKLRRVFRPKRDFEAKEIQSLKVKERARMALPLEAAARKARSALAGRHYRVQEVSAQAKTSFLARKKILGLFGSDIVHLGLLVILAGAIISGLAGVRGSLALSENQTLPVPGAGFSVRLDKFSTELYPDGNVKDWKSELTIIDADKPVLRKSVEVNHPLSYKGFVFYQSGYGSDWENPELEVAIKKKDDPGYLRTVRLRLGRPAALEDEGLTLTAERFLPDFIMDERNMPSTRSAELNNPAAFIRGLKGGAEVFSGWIFAKFPDFARMHQAQESDLKLELKDIRAPQYSVLQTAKDPGVPLIWAGCAVLMLGLFLAFYWPTREIRLVLEDSQGKTEVTAGGLSAKNRETFQAEFNGLMNALRKTP